MSDVGSSGSVDPPRPRSYGHPLNPTALPIIEACESTGNLVALAQDNLVVLFDDSLLVGSGTMVTAADGAPAILTARHVALNLAVAGAVHCVLPKWGWKAVDARSIRVHPKSDVALIVVNGGPSTGIPWDEWNPQSCGALMGDVLVAGLPGEWKGSVRLDAREMSDPRGLALACNAVPGWRGDTAQLNLTSDSGAPLSFGGMSGGPILSVSGRLVGVVSHEDLAVRRLYGVSLAKAHALTVPYQPPEDLPSDLVRQVDALCVPVRYRDARRFPHRVFHVAAGFEHWWSASDASQRVSRLMVLSSTASSTSWRYFINTESVSWQGEADLDLGSRIKRCHHELRYMLETPELEVCDSGPPAPPQAKPLLLAIMNRLAPGKNVTIMVPASEA